MWPKIVPSDFSLVAPFEAPVEASSGALQKATAGSATGSTTCSGFKGFVFFDVGSVIVDLDWDGFFAALPGIHPHPEAFDLRKTLARVQAENLISLWSTGALGPSTYAKKFAECMGVPAELFNTPAGLGYLDVKAVSSIIVGPVRARVLRLAKELRAQNYALGILSNATPWHETDIESTVSLRDNFDVVIFSQDVGAEKPDARIYETSFREASKYVSKRFGETLKPSDVYFVDDTPDNVRAAQRCGWHARLVCLLHSELFAAVQQGTLSEDELASCSMQAKNLLFGDAAAVRVEQLFANFL